MSGSTPEERVANEAARKLLLTINQEDLADDEKLMLLAMRGLIEADDDNWLTNDGYEALRQLTQRLGRKG